MTGLEGQRQRVAQLRMQVKGGVVKGRVKGGMGVHSLAELHSIGSKDPPVWDSRRQCVIHSAPTPAPFSLICR